MQYGTFVTIPVLCVIALAFRRYRLAAVIAVAGVGVYFLARGGQAGRRATATVRLVGRCAHP
jgi:hypothetical protein